MFYFIEIIIPLHIMWGTNFEYRQHKTAEYEYFVSPCLFKVANTCYILRHRIHMIYSVSMWNTYLISHSIFTLQYMVCQFSVFSCWFWKLSVSQDLNAMLNQLKSSSNRCTSRFTKGSTNPSTHTSPVPQTRRTSDLSSIQ